MRKREASWVLAIILFVAIQVWLDLEMPDYMDNITVMLSSGTATVKGVIKSGGYMMLCAIGSALASVCVGYLVARLSATVSMRVRSKVFNKVNSFSMNEINGFSTASLLTRSTNDIWHVQRFVSMGMQALIKAPILAVWAIGKIATKNWQWTLSTSIVIVFITLLVMVLLRWVFPKFKKIQTITDNLNSVTRENLKGVRVVRAYNAENYQEEKFQKANEDITKTNLFIHTIMSIMSPFMSMLMSGLSLAIYWIGAVLINGAVDLVAKQTLMGDMVVFTSYSMQVIMAFMLLISIFIMYPRTAVAGRRIGEVLSTTPSIVDGDNLIISDKRNGELEFRNVSFKYPDSDEYILKDINFKVKKGETIAFIGATGCGKSTLVNLIPRFYDVTEGEVLLDGVNIKN
jgi:ATP-binding cassette subfamily B protein